MINPEELVHLLGDYEEADSNNYKFCCPQEHPKGSDDSYKLAINKDTGQFQCWVCNFKGSRLSHLYQRLGQKLSVNLHGDIPSAIRDILYGHNEIKKVRALPPSYDQIEIVDEPKWEINVMPPDADPDILAYLHSRKLSNEQIKFFNIQGAYRIHKKSGFISKAVWIPVYYRNNLVFYQFRSIKDKFYFNYLGSKKSYHVLNIDHPYEYSILCEGAFSAFSAGYNGLCAFGKSLSEYQLDLIVQRKDSAVYCVFESDYYHKNIEAAKMLHDAGVPTYITPLPLNFDPNDLSVMTFQDLLSHSILYTGTLENRTAINIAYQRVLTLNKLLRYYTTPS